MTLAPTWLSKLLKAANSLSLYIDEQFFPVPVTKLQRQLRLRQDLEYCADLAKERVDKCKRLEDTYDANDTLTEFYSVWGDTVQGAAWYDSLVLRLRNKQNDIIKAL